MNTNNISPNIKEGLKHNFLKKAPLNLSRLVMDKIYAENKVKVAPPTNYSMAAIALIIGFTFIALPFVFPTEGASFQLPEIALPSIEIPTVAWFSFIAIAILFASDQFLQISKLKHIKI